MNLRVLRAFIEADLRFRFRRGSTLVLLGLMLGASWLWVPDPSTGRALIVIEEQRSLYTAGAIGMATASLATLFIGLFGFYAVSNAVARDLRSRVGQMLASTPLSKTAYIVGRFLGNLAFLASLLAVYAAGSFIMVFVRGEGDFDPGRFASQYLLMCTPAVVGVSALAILFEVTPLLRTRAGDVGFFFLWMTIMGMNASSTIHTLPVHWLDLSGFGWMLEQMREEVGTSAFGIGATRFDTALPPIPFNGIPMTLSAVISRAGSVLLPFALLIPAVMLFHRFDPARIRSAGPSRSPRGPRFSFLSALVGWIPVPRSKGLAGAAALDARLTLLERPLAALGIVAAWVAGAVGGKGAVAVVVIAAGAIVAGVASRERQFSTNVLVAPSAVVGDRRGIWKLLSSLLLCLVIGLPLLLRLLGQDGFQALRFAGGLVLIGGAANLFGFLTGGSRTFLAVLLAAVYVAVNTQGMSAMDFAGFTSTPPTAAGHYWLLASALVAGLSVLVGRPREE